MSIGLLSEDAMVVAANKALCDYEQLPPEAGARLRLRWRRAAAGDLGEVDNDRR